MTLNFVIPAKAETELFSHEGTKSTRATKQAKLFAIFVSFVPSCEPNHCRSAVSCRMIAIIIGIIVAVLLIGLVLKLLKIAIVVALAVGVVMFAQNKLGTKKRIR